MPEEPYTLSGVIFMYIHVTDTYSSRQYYSFGEDIERVEYSNITRYHHTNSLIILIHWRNIKRNIAPKYSGPYRTAHDDTLIYSSTICKISSTSKTAYFLDSAQRSTPSTTYQRPQDIFHNLVSGMSIMTIISIKKYIIHHN